MNEPQDRWHVDRSVNLAVVVAMAALVGTTGASVGAGIWFASSMSTRLGIVEDTIKANSGSIERIIRVETQTQAIHEDVKDIKHLLQVPQDQRR